MGAGKIQPVPLRKLRERKDFIPQAILKRPMHSFERQFRVDLEQGIDQLDHYVGIGFVFRGQCEFALMRYDGYPENTATIYLPGEIRDVDTITELVGKIMHELDVPASSIEWQRRDDPDL